MPRMSINRLLIVSILAWILVQTVKTLICFIKSKRWNFRKLLESGGMPSAHSAFVSSLSYGVACKYGVSSDFFTIALAFSLIVMYDALGVRYEAGKHAKILNELQKKIEIPEKLKLNESLGHSPLEVALGAASGIGISALAQLIVN